MSEGKKVHMNYDAVFKEALLLYKNKTLDFVGLDLAMIEEPIHTEMTEVKVDKRFADMCFMLKDKTGLHLEWEADLSMDDLLRFCSYHLYYLRIHKTKFTTVVFTNRTQPITEYETENLRFSPIFINLGTRDGDALLQKIKEQIQTKQTINELELIYLPLYHSKYRNVAEMLEQVVELAPLVSESKEENERIMILSAVVANKFIKKADLSRIWEAIKMYVDDLLIVQLAKEDAKAEGRAENKIEVSINLIKCGVDIETIADCTGLSIDELKEIQAAL